jgi:hypothetical protein
MIRAVRLTCASNGLSIVPCVMVSSATLGQDGAKLDQCFVGDPHRADADNAESVQVLCVLCYVRGNVGRRHRRRERLRFSLGHLILPFLDRRGRPRPPTKSDICRYVVGDELSDQALRLVSVRQRVAKDHRSSSSSALACFKSTVSKPSVNQP